MVFWSKIRLERADIFVDVDTDHVFDSFPLQWSIVKEVHFSGGNFSNSAAELKCLPKCTS